MNEIVQWISPSCFKSFRLWNIWSNQSNHVHAFASSKRYSFSLATSRNKSRVWILRTSNVTLNSVCWKCFWGFLLDFLFCPVSLLFAAFWIWKLPFFATFSWNLHEFAAFCRWKLSFQRFCSIFEPNSRFPWNLQLFAMWWSSTFACGLAGGTCWWCWSWCWFRFFVFGKSLMHGERRKSAYQVSHKNLNNQPHKTNHTNYSEQTTKQN